MQSNVHLAKRVDLAALAHLSERCSKLADSEECKAALDTLVKALGVDPRSKSDVYKYGTDATLSELIAGGLEKFGSTSTRRPGDDDIFASAKFIKYLEAVRKKGVFDKVTEGTPEHNEIMEKVKNAFAAKFEPSKPSLSKEEAEKKAEELKLQGNEKLAASDYDGAIALYDQCIELSPDGPNTHIYYSNRAAAYTQLKQFERAIEDSVAALALKPDFAKAHSRLANAFFNLNRIEEAQQSAERTLELDPSNGVAIAVLDKIKSQKDAAKVKGAGARSAPSGPAGGMPRGMPGGLPGGFPGMGGGMPDLSSMMNDPMMRQMMQDPQMMQMAQQMMSDPNAMANIMNMMGGGGRGRQ